MQTIPPGNVTISSRGIVFIVTLLVCLAGFLRFAKVLISVAVTFFYFILLFILLATREELLKSSRLSVE